MDESIMWIAVTAAIAVAALAVSKCFSYRGELGAARQHVIQLEVYARTQGEIAARNITIAGQLQEQVRSALNSCDLYKRVAERQAAELDNMLGRYVNLCIAPDRVVRIYFADHASRQAFLDEACIGCQTEGDNPRMIAEVKDPLVQPSAATQTDRVIADLLAREPKSTQPDDVAWLEKLCGLPAKE